MWTSKVKVTEKSFVMKKKMLLQDVAAKEELVSATEGTFIFLLGCLFFLAH